VPGQTIKSKRRKRVRRKTRTREKPAVSSSFAPRIEILARQLSQLQIASCTRARLDITLHTSDAHKREVFDAALCSWLYETYKLVLGGLQQAIADIRQVRPGSEPLMIFRSAEEEVSIALAEGLGHTPLHKDKLEKQKHKCRPKDRLSSLGAGGKSQNLEDLIADDGALDWLREYSADWLKLACDDPAEGIGCFLQWRAPAWAVAETNSADGRATPEETQILFDDVAGRLRNSLNNARFDAFEPLRGQNRKTPRNFRMIQRQAIARIRSADRSLRDHKKIASILDMGIPVKVNDDSSGKPNGIPVKANSRRSEATLACSLCLEVFGFVKIGAPQGGPGAKRRSFGGDLGCRGKGRPAPLSPAYPCRSTTHF